MAGSAPGTSFDGQAFPLIWHAFAESCFNASARGWLLGKINASLPMTIAAATPQEYSYTNMWLMSTVNSILFGEIVGGERGRISADVGYEMWAEFYNYTMRAGLHEFTSPTYTYVRKRRQCGGLISASPTADLTRCRAQSSPRSTRATCTQRAQAREPSSAAYST